MKVGVIGLGAMGGAIAANLVDRGFAVVGFDIDEGQVARLSALGGSIAESVADLARQVDAVIVSLPTEQAFADVALSEDGIAGGGVEGLVIIESSTLPIDLKERARALLSSRGLTLLDCPLSGTGDQAITRDLVVLASGDAAMVERCVPVFEGFARAHYYLGEFGTGSKMKFVANLLVAIHNVAAAEALSLAEAAGLDLRQALDVLLDGAGASRMLEQRGPKMVAHDYRTGVRTKVFQKDIAVIADFAAGLGVSLPTFALTSELYAATAAAGYGDVDSGAVYEVISRRRAQGV